MLTVQIARVLDHTHHAKRARHLSIVPHALHQEAVHVPHSVVLIVVHPLFDVLHRIHGLVREQDQNLVLVPALDRIIDQ